MIPASKIWIYLSEDAADRWQFYSEQSLQSGWKDEKPIKPQITFTKQFNIHFVICSHRVLKKMGSLNEFWLNKPVGIDCSLESGWQIVIQ